MLKFASLLFTICIFNLKTQYTLGSSSCSRSDKWPEDQTTPFNFPTNTPVDFQTDTARVVTTPTPFTVNVSLEDQVQITNTGSTVALTLQNNNTKTKSLCTGGILKDNKYFYHGTYFFWNQDYKQPCCSAEDGTNGAPLAAGVIYVNEKYDSLENALKHRDGLTILTIRFSVQGVLPNPLFSPLQNSLTKVTKAKSSTSITNDMVAPFFEVLADAEFNYIYPGSYIQLEGSVQYPAATIVVPQLDVMPFISVQQFQVFLTLLNPSNSPINAVLTSFSQNECLPLLQVPGTSLNFV